jgi:hypothetical protein
MRKVGSRTGSSFRSTAERWTRWWLSEILSVPWNPFASKMLAEVSDSPLSEEA